MLSGLHGFGLFPMGFKDWFQIEGFETPLFHHNLAIDDEGIHARRMTEQQGPDRLACAGVADVIERKDGDIRRFTRL